MLKKSDLCHALLAVQRRRIFGHEFHAAAKNETFDYRRFKITKLAHFASYFFCKKYVKLFIRRSQKIERHKVTAVLI